MEGALSFLQSGSFPELENNSPSFSKVKSQQIAWMIKTHMVLVQKVHSQSAFLNQGKYAHLEPRCP